MIGSELGVVPLDLYVDNLSQKAVARTMRSLTLRKIDSRVATILRGQGRRGRTPKAESPFRTMRKTMQSKAEALGVSLTPETNGEALKAVKKALDKNLQKEWEERWAKGTKGAHSRHLQPQLDKKLTRVHSGL
jgi:hypothetical protein